LIPIDGRPVLLKITDVIDIVRRNNKYNVLLIANIAGETVFMRLETTPEQIKAIKEHTKAIKEPDRYKEEYAAIITQISSISRKYENDNTESYDWFIDGRCVDLLFYSDIKSP